MHTHLSAGSQQMQHALMCGSSSNRVHTWLESEPCSSELPCVAVATAPPIVWSMNQEKAGSV